MKIHNGKNVDDMSNEELRILLKGYESNDSPFGRIMAIDIKYYLAKRSMEFIKDGR
jgi:hypothetical protein